MSEIHRVALLGFGEVGSTLAEPLLSLGLTVTAYDCLFDDAESKPSLNLKRLPNVNGAVAPGDAFKDVDLVISVVTAEQDLTAANAVAEYLQPNTWFLDLNSVAPATKIAVSEVIDGVSGRYVEGAVMSPINPKGLASPMLFGGPHAEQFLPIARDIGFSGAKFCDQSIGKAAATKMCRSVMIKGMEALLSESLFAARHYGVEEEVISSLNNLMPGVDWHKHAAYMISRSLEHGVRRAEEMREAAKTVAETGIQPRMSSAAAKTQEWVASLGDDFASQALPELLDQMIKNLEN